MKQYQNIVDLDSLGFGFSKIRRFFSMAEKLSMSDGRDRKFKKIKYFLRNILYRKYIVLAN